MDCEDRLIRWKDEQQDLITGVPAGLTVPTSKIKRCQQPQINPDHQHDADRRDALMEQQIRKGQIKVLHRPAPVPKGSHPSEPTPKPTIMPKCETHALNLRESYSRMNKELKAESDPNTKPSRTLK